MSTPPDNGGQPPPWPGPPPGSDPPQSLPRDPGFGWNLGPWQPPPAPPQRRGISKWLLIAVALLVVVGVSVAATLFVTGRGGGRGAAALKTSTPSDFASAGDTGPVSIITDEPTCDEFLAINDELATIEANGWSERRGGLGASQRWTRDERLQVGAVAGGMSRAAEVMTKLALRTPHRVVRELYLQSLLYGRLYAKSLAHYQPGDNSLADVFVNGSSAIAGMCVAISKGAASRAIAVDPAPSPSLPPEDIDEAKRVVPSWSSDCAEWVAREKVFVSSTERWSEVDAGIPASMWSPPQVAEQLAVYPVLRNYAIDIERAGRKSRNQIIEDFATSAALYLRAYLAAQSTYTSADSWLVYAAFRFSNTITGACLAAAS